jgi:hypothetical protein
LGFVVIRKGASDSIHRLPEFYKMEDTIWLFQKWQTLADVLGGGIFGLLAAMKWILLKNIRF